jgi:hypothetical protein
MGSCFSAAGDVTDRRFLALGLASGLTALAGGVLRLITDEAFGLPLTVVGAGARPRRHPGLPDHAARSGRRLEVTAPDLVDRLWGELVVAGDRGYVVGVTFRRPGGRSGSIPRRRATASASC